MTTDRKIFDFRLLRGIIAKTEYPGVAKVVSRLIWVQETGRSSRPTRTKAPRSIAPGGFFLVYCGAGFEGIEHYIRNGYVFNYINMRLRKNSNFVIMC